MTSELSRAANMMSCQAMISMAQEEARQNMYTLDSLVNHPACERFQSLADRALERNELQANPKMMIPRKLCVYKTIKYGTGDWINYMDTPRGGPVTPIFDQRTRSR
jgi:hypothetical protein